MAGILDGNIFESMRLILPEHREYMARLDRDIKQLTKPEISQDQFEEMWFTLSEAMENGSKVRITLFGEYGNRILKGLPSVENGRLTVHTDDDVERVMIERLLGIEMI